MTHAAVWHTDTQSARLQTAALTARIDARRPQAGLQDWLLRGQPSHEIVQVLGIELTPAASEHPLIEHYARGTDLVATYAQTPARTVRVQGYWRALNAAECDAEPLLTVELQVSVQTSLLDSQPSLYTHSALQACPVQRLMQDQRTDFADVLAAPTFSRGTGPACWLFQPAGCDWSYAEMVHPEDFSESQLLATAGQLALRHVLFAPELIADGLEKGVILRARVRGVFVPRTNDAQLAAASYHAFVASEPPLTT